MNILLLSQFFSTTKGGGEYVFQTIAETLSESNNKVWVITHKMIGEDHLEKENLKIFTVKPELVYQGGLPPSFLDNIRYVINAYRLGKNLVKKHNIDLIHSNNFSPALAGSLISFFTKKPHITTIHDIFSTQDKKFWREWGKQSGVSRINASLIPFFERMMMWLRIDCIHTVSEQTKKDIQVLGTKKTICVIPNCIQEIQSFVTENKSKQFVYLGRLVFYKNIEVVLKAFKIVIQEFPEAKLIIAGEGPYKNPLQELVNKLKIGYNVEFTGYVSPQRKYELLAESNALLFPSLIEGFGLVILESFQQKKPVLVSNIPPMSEIIENKKTGLVIEPHEEKKWAEAIIDLIKNPNQSKIMGENGKRILETKYNLELFRDKLLKMYDDVISESKSHFQNNK